jgi:hypothetical protein
MKEVSCSPLVLSEVHRVPRWEWGMIKHARCPVPGAAALGQRSNPCRHVPDLIENAAQQPLSWTSLVRAAGWLHTRLDGLT